MIINIFSTPRTGSNHYTEYIKHQLVLSGKKCVIATEAFNPYRLGMYHMITDGKFKNFTTYQDGSYWVKPVFDSESISTERVFEERHISFGELSNLWLAAHVKMINSDTILISHNHVMPCMEDISLLASFGSENYYCKRHDIYEQISSYVIAYHTKIFAYFEDEKITSKYTESIIDINVIRSLINRIRESDIIMNNLHGIKEVYYEDMDFENSKFKRYTSGKTFDLLCDHDQDLIKTLINEKHIS